MTTNSIVTKLQQTILQPERLWPEVAAEAKDTGSFLSRTVAPVITVTAVLSALLLKIFGYHLPMVGVIRPSLTDMLLQMVGTVVIYLVSIAVLGWIAAYLAGMLGGKNDPARAIAMLFWISVPSMLGQILGTLPMVGWIMSLGLGIYSLVLLYRAIPVFLEVPLSDRVKHFIFFLIAAFAVSVVLGMTIGRIFTPRDMMQNIRPDIMLPQTTEGKSTVTSSAAHTAKSENPVEDYVKSMSKGDYDKEVIRKSAEDRFSPPADGRLTPEQVNRFLELVQKVKTVEKEQAEKLKQKYDRKEKSEDFSVSDIFNGLKDFTSLATLEMKVVKTNGGNWAEYQWVKDRVREAYYTPSLNETTAYNATLLKGKEALLKEIL